MNRPTRLGVVVMCWLACVPAIGAQALSERLVFGGNSAFEPYEYLDRDGQPQGFNVSLVRALAREAGIAIDIRLTGGNEALAQLDRGDVDFVFMLNDDRARQYSLLDQTWTLSQVVLMRAGLPRYPTGLDDLAGFKIAVARGSFNQNLIESLPRDRQPEMRFYATRELAVRGFEAGEADGVVGVRLALMTAATTDSSGMREVALVARPYNLAVLPGREARVAPLRTALARLRTSGEFERLVEAHLAVRPAATWLERSMGPLVTLAGVMMLVVVGGFVWNRSLSRQVRLRTHAVERSERQFRDLVENASDMIYRCDVRGQFVFVNPVATRMLGYTEAELKSMYYTDLIRPDWVSRTVTFYQDAALRREATYFEFPIRTKDGQELWVGQHARPLVSGGDLNGFQGVARDVTDRVSAQVDLRAERDFVSKVLDTAPSLVMVLDRHGCLVRFNRACEALSGVSLASVVGRPLWELPFVLDVDRDGIEGRFPQLLAAGRPVQIDRVWLDPEGNRHVIAFTASAITSEAGEPEALIAVGVDVTAARELDRFKTQFVSMVSHELRTPLTSIRASLQLLLPPAAAAPDDEDSQLLRVALTNTERLIRIVNDILDLSKIEAGEMLVSPRPSALGPVVDESVKVVEGFARDARVAMRVTMPDRLPLVNVDQDRSIQVLVNLLSNALKHAPQGSEVAVEVRAEADHVAIVVRDVGPGVPASKIDAIFEPFTQVDSSDTRRVAGTGLGLTIARALAERQGGTVTVASREGHGAAFTLTVPIVRS